ncbi:MAG: transporter substrate-binding domain-containing protein [Burkholderiaceae bacterium]|nr:transporter substrate-binding domain-containing protein [Burkholderiaceae bacterium]
MNLLMQIMTALISTSVAAETPGNLHISVNVDSATGMIAASILREVYKQTKLEFCIINLPPLRATKEAKAGNIDGEVLRPPNYAASHPELIRIDPPFIVVETLAYTLKPRNLTIQKKSDLKPLRIGVVRGIINAQNATEGLNDITFADTSESLFKMLTAGRIDVAVDSRYSADRAMKKTMINDIVSEKIVLLVQPAHHYLNIKHKALAASLATTISQLAATGELQRLATTAESEQMKNDNATATLPVKNCS